MGKGFNEDEIGLGHLKCYGSEFRQKVEANQVNSAFLAQTDGTFIFFYQKKKKNTLMVHSF